MKPAHLVAVLGALGAACGGSNTTPASMDMAPAPVKLPPAFVTKMGMESPAKLDCLGSRVDPAAPTDDYVNEGFVKDFQDSLPISGAVVSIYFDAASVMSNTPVAKSDPSDATGHYKVTIPKGHYRVIMGNSGGKAMKGGVAVNTIPTYEFDRIYNDKQRAAVLVTTRDAIPGLVSVQPDVTLGVVAGSVRDCDNTEMGGARVSIKTPAAYDGDSFTFYFVDVNGSTLPTRKQKYTSGVGVFAALNVPPGSATLSVQAVVGGGDPKPFGTASIPVLSGAITIVDILPASGK